MTTVGNDAAVQRIVRDRRPFTLQGYPAHWGLMANRDDHSDVDNPQIQLDVVEAAKWAIGQAFRRTVEDTVASATAYYVGLRGLPSPEVQATLSRKVQGRLQAAEAVEANAAQV